MVAIRWGARSSFFQVCRATAFVVFVSISSFAPPASGAAEDDLALDLGSASDKPSDAGAALRKLELRRIPRGTFVEGSPASDAYREPDEVQRNVTISKTFWMSKYPVTRAQFARFVAETRHQTDAEKGQSGGFGWDGVRLKQDKQFTWRNPGFTQTDDDPVTLVTFGDANAFTAWASRKTGRRVRLPTEAEFEFAARAGTTTPWYAAKSEEESAALGWYRPQPGQAVGTHPVGRKKPNAFGLFDMTGNVNQWCRDVYAVWPAADVTDPENTTNPTTEPERRVLRGGSWLRDPRRGRSAARYRNTPGTRNADNGFRVVVEDAPVIAPAPGQASSADLAPSAMPAPVADAPTNAVDAGPIIQATPVIQRPPSSEGIGWTFFAAPFGAIAFVVSWMLVRRRKEEEVDPQAITTRPGEDGFWIRAPNLVAGSRVRYTCIVKGTEVSEIVSLGETAETFVFTDGAPTLIHVTESIAGSSSGHRSSARMPVAAPITPPPSVSAAPVAQVSPWPSDRGLPVQAPAVAPPPPPPPPSPSPEPPPPIPAVPPPAPSTAPAPIIPPPAPSSRPVALQPPPVPSSSKVPPAPSSSRVPAPLPSSKAPPAPLSSSKVPPAPLSSSKVPPAPLSSSKVPPAPLSASKVPPAPPSSARSLVPSKPPALPSGRPPLSKAPLPPAIPSTPPVASAPPGPRDSEPPGPRSSKPFMVSPIVELEKKLAEFAEKVTEEKKAEEAKSKPPEEPKTLEREEKKEEEKKP